jgi:secreted trypsin-like serine protease
MTLFRFRLLRFGLRRSDLLFRVEIPELRAKRRAQPTVATSGHTTSALQEIKQYKMRQAMLQGLASRIIALVIATVTSAAALGQSVQRPRTPLDLVRERMASRARMLAPPGTLTEKLLPSAIKSNPDRIILGKPAPHGAFLFQVSLLSSAAASGREFDGHFCGGTLISATWVLTAGHCVTENETIASPGDINVYVGSQDFQNGDRIPVQAIYRHPEYIAGYFENDVALLQLARFPEIGIPFDTIQPVDARDEARLVAPGTALTIVGWGTTEADQPSRQLRRTTVNVIDRAACNASIMEHRAKDIDDLLSPIASEFRIARDRIKTIRDAIFSNAGTLVTDNMICAGDATAASPAAQVADACQGDSGGPLLATDSDGSVIQVGIVSWGEGCGIPGLSGLYTRLSRYRNWMKDVARDGLR